jgi:cysteine desulfurase
MSAVYLDNCATTMVCKQAALKAMTAMTETYGNPSSLHTMGVDAEKMLKTAREQIASSLHCSPDEIYFTSGGTESNNLAVFGAVQALRRRGKRIVTTMIEHPSVAQAVNRLEKEGYEIIRLRPAQDGTISQNDIINAITADTILVSLMLVNNETGSIQPVEAARREVKSVGSPALIHCDAVQAYGRLNFTPAKLGVDLLSLSAHKIHAPKGAGALFVAKGARILPVTLGGGQEKGIRPGTEPVPTIAAFGEAAQIAFEHLDEYAGLMASLKDYCIQLIKELPFITVNSPLMGAPHILNISVDGIRSETMLHYLASKGIYVSAGSACSKGEKSRVLTAMGLPDSRIDSALRISFSRYNTKSDVEALVHEIATGAQTLSHIKQFYSR